MDIPAVQPPKIKTGDTIAIIAPAGPIETVTAWTAESLHWKEWGSACSLTSGYSSHPGIWPETTSARAEELMRAFEDPSIQAIIALRGGYGCSRLIPLLMEKRLRHHPKIFMGFSDLTTLHLYFSNVSDG